MKIKVSDRLSSTSEYYFSLKMNEINKKQAAGIDVINLAIGNPNMRPADSVIEKLKETVSKPDVHGYQHHRGQLKLREAFAKWYNQNYGVELNPENEVLSLIGSKEGIFHVSFALLNPGDKVLIPDPGYPMYRFVAAMMQAEPVFYDLKEENSWLPDLEKLESKIDDKVKMIWVNYPNMPSGESATIEFFTKLVEIAKKHDVLVINDNPYSFILNKTEPLSILSVPGAKEVAIELNTLSKSHGMAGWRVGMAVGNPEVLDLMLKVKSNLDSGIFLPVQEAAIEALTIGQGWYEDLTAIYLERQEAAKKFAQVLGCTYSENAAGMYLWAKLPENVTNSREFADSLFEDKHVFVAPGTLYGSNGEGYIRISLCQPVEKIHEAIERVQE